MIICPKCKTSVPKKPICNECGFNMKAYFIAKKKRQASIICPKCEATVPRKPVCTECGFNIKAHYEALKQKKARKAAMTQKAAPEQKAAPAPPPSTGVPQASEAGLGEAEPVAILSLGELFSESFDVFKLRWLTLVVLNILVVVLAGIMFVVPFLLGILIGLVSGDLKGVVIGVFVFIATVSSVLGATWGISALTAATADRTLGIKEALVRGRGMIWSYLWMVSLAWIAIWGGYMLLIVPGVVFSIWAVPAMFVLFSEDERGMSAILKGREYVRGYFWDTFIKILVVMIAMGVVSVIPFGALVAYPFVMIFMHQMYLNLRKVKGSVVMYPTSFKAKFAWVGTGIIGIMLPVVVSLVLALTAGKGAMDQFRSAFEGGAIIQMQDTGPGASKGQRGQRGQSGQSGQSGGGGQSKGGASLSIPGNSFQPGQSIVVTFSVSSSYPSDAWVGIIPSSVPHGSETVNDRHNLTYQYLNRRTSGTMTFAAPASPGDYDLRMHDTDSGGREVASISFTVSGTVSGGVRAPASAMSDAVLATTRDGIQISESITIEYSGFSGSEQDWITMVDASESNETFGQWFYTEGKTSGTYTFSGVGAGSYELRGYFDWPSGGYTVQSRHAFTVGSGSEASSGGQNAANWDRSGKSGATGEATIVLDGNIVQYELRTGFFSDTRFAEPTRAQVQFQIEIPEGDEFSSGDRIEMVLDSTKRGRHYVDGQAVADSFMGENRVNVGNPSARGFEARLQWVANGGQIFFPKGDCFINVDQAYTGGADSVFSGSISDCTVHSAGIDKHISSFSFTMRGQPKS